MEYRAFRFDCKALDPETGVFQGYASTFGNVDLGGDMIEPGAFTQTLKHKKGKVVLLHQHDPAQRVGIAYLEEDGKGLKVSKGILNLDNPLAQTLFSDLKFYREHDLPMEMSIGFETVKKDLIDGVRHLREVKLWEVSLVTFAMNPKARVQAVKTTEDSVLLERIQALEGKVDAMNALLATLEDGPRATPTQDGDGVAPPSPPATDTHAAAQELARKIAEINATLKRS